MAGRSIGRAGMVAGAVWLLFGGAAAADPAPPFAELLRQSLEAAPILAERRAEVRAAQGQADQGATRPNPQLSLEVEDFAGSGAYGGLSRSQSTLSASQTLELGGKRRTRVEAGRAEVAAAAARERQARADFAFDLAAAYMRAEQAEARSRLVAQDLERAEEDLRAARALVEAGKEAELRTVQATAAVGAVRAQLESARAEAADALGGLSALAGAPAPFTAVGPSLLELAPARPLPSPPRPDAYPAVASAAAERDAAERRVAVERARGAPNLTVSLGARRLEGEDATTFVGGFSAPLPLFDRNRGAVSAALAQRDAADARLRAAELGAEAEWRSALNRASAAASGLKAALEGEAAASEAYRLSRVGYDAGRAPLVEVLAARRAMLEAQIQALEAKAQRMTAEAALARLAGQLPFGG